MTMRDPPDPALAALDELEASPDLEDDAIQYDDPKDSWERQVIEAAAREPGDDSLPYDEWEDYEIPDDERCHHPGRG